MPIESPRVLHVIARLNKGGTARYLQGLIKDLEQMQVESLLAVGHVQGNEIEDESLQSLRHVRVNSLGRSINPIRDVLAYFELKKIVQGYQPDLIHTHTFKAGLLGRLLKAQTPIVHTFHGHLLTDPEFSGFKQRVIIGIEKVLAKRSAALITVGEKVSEELLAVGIGKKEQHLSITSEIDSIDFISRDTAREKFGVADENQVVVVWMARLVGVKNPYLAIEVAKLLPKALFFISGGGDLYEQLNRDSPANVRVLGWQEPSEVIPAGDIFLSTSVNEGVPYSILEAQSFGLPVVSVRAGAVEEVVIETETGYVTEAVAAQLAARIQSLIRDPSMRLQMGERARSRSLEATGKKAKATAHLALYRRILSPKLQGFGQEHPLA
jgi:glycosyltransferase involved in cell wall biosynthesis